MIKFEGVSDDLIHITVNGETEEYPFEEGKGFKVDDKLVVTPVHGTNACWSFAVGVIDEDQELPPYWEYQFTAIGYSTNLYINNHDEMVGLEIIEVL